MKLQRDFKMSNTNLKYEVYNIHFNKAKEALANKDYGIAKEELLISSKLLYELALESKGELKEVRLQNADRLLSYAKSIKIEPKIITSENNESTIKNNETETMWSQSEIPNVSLNDVIGLKHAKEAIDMRILNPIKYQDLYKAYNKKIGGGILLYGLPGTGKTMTAKAIAHEANARFYAVKCSEIVSKWFGESERNIKNLFDEARKYDRSIIFFDEFESLASKRNGDSSAMNRIVPELLAQIQGFNESNKMLMLLAATNRPWDIDSAMLRPGRFSELIYVELPDFEARKEIILNCLKGCPIEDNIDFNAIGNATIDYSGADLAELCEYIKYSAILRSKDDMVVKKINESDVDYAFSKSRSSISQTDKEALEKFNKENNIM